MGRTVCFGEVMLRLSPPGRELLLQTPRLESWVAGAEANVAIALARLGHQTAMVTALPDNPLGDAALTALRGHGVDCAGVLRHDGRMGLYFSASGAGMRATQVLYDRANSSFSRARADLWDWPALLAGAERLHLSGITAAVSVEAAEAARVAAETAAAMGIAVSFDGNYRAQLWKDRGVEPRDALFPLVEQADLLFGNHRDIALLLGRDLSGDAGGQRRHAAEAAFAAFPRLRLIASTIRRTIDVDSHTLTARIDTRDDTVETDELSITGIIERIGTGDAFAAGVLHGLATGASIAASSDLGLRLSALKHSLPGDVSLFDRRTLHEFGFENFDLRR